MLKPCVIDGRMFELRSTGVSSGARAPQWQWWAAGWPALTSGKCADRNDQAVEPIVGALLAARHSDARHLHSALGWWLINNASMHRAVHDTNKSDRDRSIKKLTEVNRRPSEAKGSSREGKGGSKQREGSHPMHLRC